MKNLLRLLILFTVFLIQPYTSFGNNDTCKNDSLKAAITATYSDLLICEATLQTCQEEVSGLKQIITIHNNIDLKKDSLVGDYLTLYSREISNTQAALNKYYDSELKNKILQAENTKYKNISKGLAVAFVVSILTLFF